MPAYSDYPLPHLLGRVDYSGAHNFDPDGDTVHLRRPVLLVNGKAIQPQNGRFKVWMPGNEKPRFIALKGKASPYVPIRLEGIDAPEEHYRSTPFTLEKNGKKTKIPYNPAHAHDERSAPRWKPATDHLIGTLQKAGWALVALDREVTDKYGRVLGYVYASTKKGAKGAFVSLDLVKRGLAFPFLFESAGASRIRTFLKASESARKAKKGVWKKYVEAPLPYSKTFPRPERYTSPEPAAQANAPLNMPMVFRRVVDAWQLKGLSLKDALRKYDAIDFLTGDIVPGDRFREIPVGRRIWAPHLLR